MDYPDAEDWHCVVEGGGGGDGGPVQDCGWGPDSEAVEEGKGGVVEEGFLEDQDCGVGYAEIFLGARLGGGLFNCMFWFLDGEGGMVGNGVRTNITAYLLTSTCRLRKLDDMSATTRGLEKGSEEVGSAWRMEGKEGNSTPSTVSLSQ